jgi:carboxymethylenebutenolidase
MSLTRREFLVTSGAAAGFALAVRPISAETIITDTTGLRAGMVAVPAAGGDMPAYHALPDSGGPFPIVLVVQEIFGLHEYIRDVCRRFAKAGYLAVAPDLYFRQGDVTKVPDVGQIVSKFVSRVPDSQVMADLDATAKWARESGHGDATKMGVTGFCWGGRITWLYCAHGTGVKAGGAWYGRLVGESSELQPKHPVDVASSLKAPVLGLYGADDQGIPQDTVERMRIALKAAGGSSEIIVYPGAPHGFHADYRPGYRRQAAEDAWRRLLDWFEKHGAAA